ncbi:hypothetical protein HYV50_02365 [Candidatus Pacearchaeota archaeon]|nr:hypothetical protein [Candidatus Pacearchaeota archaeon]
MWLEIIILVLAFPAGYIIAWLCNDELVKGRKWFIFLIALSFIVEIISFVKNNLQIALTSLFIIIVSLISLFKSYDKKFIKRRI